MKISVVVCTHNRCELLQKALNSLVVQDFPVSEYEIIVVDNCSTDRTKDIVREVSDSLKKQGRNNLLGAGAQDRVFHAQAPAGFRAKPGDAEGVFLRFAVVRRRQRSGRMNTRHPRAKICRIYR